MAKARGRMVEKTCLHCGNTFEVREAEVKRGWGKFCSRNHHYDYRKVITETKVRLREIEYA